MYVNLFQNTSRSIRIGDRVAHYGGEHCISALIKEDGGVILQQTALGHHDERLYGGGELKPAVKHSPKSPDVRGKMESAEGETTWTVAGWWKQTRTGEAYLSLSLT